MEIDMPPRSKLLQTLDGGQIEIVPPEPEQYQLVERPNKYKNINGNKKGARLRGTLTVERDRSKLTSARATIILEAIKDGLPLKRTCALAGIDYQTLLNWIRKGEQQTQGKFRWFYEECLKADSECEISCLKTIQDAIKGNHTSIKERKIYNKKGILVEKEVTRSTAIPSWTAAMTLLERRYPKRWSRSDRLQVSEDPENPMISKQTLLDFLTQYVGKPHSSIDMNNSKTITIDKNPEN